MTNKQNHKASQTVTKHTRNLTLVLCMGMLAGVLIWAKLRLVTDIPRSAYADPNETKLLHDQAIVGDHDQMVEAVETELKNDESDDDSTDSGSSIEP